MYTCTIQERNKINREDSLNFYQCQSANIKIKTTHMMPLKVAWCVKYERKIIYIVLK